MSPKIMEVYPASTITFYDHCIPALEAGRYQIVVSQAIEGINTGNYFQPQQQQILVQGPQFTLAPAEIHAIYPPASSNGDFGLVLPHIVLNTPELPWERLLTSQDNTIPWLALLVFRENELTIDAATGSPLLTGTVQQLLEADDAILKPAIPINTLGAAEQNASCQSIIISSEVFEAVVPRLEELKYLAHCRCINSSSMQDETGNYAVVVGNRLPAPNGKKNYVHLVSLEGYSDYLTDNPTFPATAGNPALPKKIQLVSLANWTFTSAVEAPESFARLVRNFTITETGDPANLLLRLPATDNGITAGRLGQGYVPLSYHTKTGENTFAWYRGPFSPVVPQPLPNNLDTTNAAAAMIYDQTSAVFDLSYSAAWEAGRAIALADRHFTHAIQGMYVKIRQLATRFHKRKQSRYFNLEENPEQVTGQHLIRKKFDGLMANNMGHQITQLLSNSATMLQEPSQPPPPKPVLQKLTLPVLKQLLQDRRFQDYFREHLQADTEPVKNWIDQLMLLNNVPFMHLVPDIRMLPAESIRFFYIDQGWLNCLTAGALSIGIKHSTDVLLHSMIRPAGPVREVHKTLAEHENIVKGMSAFIAPKSGILIRSALISGWPGLEVTAQKNGAPLEVLRKEKMSADVLMCLFSGIPDTVTLGMPKQGLCFGLEDDNTIQLRSLTGTVGEPLGQNITMQEDSPAFLRPLNGSVGGQVLNINTSPATGNILQLLYKVLNSTLSPAGFAIQMVKGAEQISFIISRES